MKVVFDANILISALLIEQGPSGQLLDLFTEGGETMVVSSTVLDEVFRVLHRPRVARRYQLTDQDIAEYTGALRRRAVVTPGNASVDVLPSDPDDVHVVAAAIEAEADAIVTGDGHLLDLGAVPGIPVLTARELLTRLQQTSPTEEE